MSAAVQPSVARQPLRTRSTRYIPVVFFGQLVVVAILMLLASRSWWGAAGAALILLLAILLLVPVNGRALWATLRARHRFAARQRSFVEEPDLPAELVPLGQWLPQLQITQTRSAASGDIGVVADGTSWTALLELTSDDVLIVDRGGRTQP